IRNFGTSDPLMKVVRFIKRHIVAVLRVYIKPYCAILKTHMLPSARTLFRQGQNWMFQQDNAPRHRSRARRTWLQDHCIQVLEWPAQSLDMSPIQNLKNPGAVKSCSSVSSDRT
uniref:Tc1-like transposase DDE domain-containing protein n=1 Tax=Lates calcarifer TaxID=8187 RepID=A0A4W6DMN7_LATCA